MSYDVKQVIILRLKYPDGKGGIRNLRFGKLAAMAAHASNQVFLNMHDPEITIYNFGKNDCPSFLTIPVTENMQKWMNGSYAKIVLAVDTEQELLDLYEDAKSKNLPCALIVDSGVTEFNRVPTVTSLAIGPDDVSKIDEVTRYGKVTTRLA